MHISERDAGAPPQATSRPLAPDPARPSARYPVPMAMRHADDPPIARGFPLASAACFAPAFPRRRRRWAALRPRAASMTIESEKTGPSRPYLHVRPWLADRGLTCEGEVFDLE